MRHDYSLTGVAFSLRPVSLNDAEFMYQLRTDKRRTQYLHSISDAVEDQEKWLESYFERDDDYYFVIIKNCDGLREGLIGLYDVSTTSAEWGRWILASGSSAALESAYLIHRFGFELLECERIFCRTVVDNEQVLSFHRTFGASEEIRLIDEFTIDGKRYDAIQHGIFRRSWPEIRDRHLALLKRLAQKLQETARR